MRLVLANPHYYSYGRTLVNALLRRKDFMKYRYFLDRYLKSEGKDTAIYIDGTKTSLAAIKIRFPFFPKFFTYLELFIWMLLNGVNPLKQKVYFDLAKLDPTNDVLVDFARAKVGKEGQREEEVFPGMKVIILTHYYLQPKDIADNFNGLNGVLLVAENDLAAVPYFKRYFPWVETVYQLPFTFTERFRKQTEFLSRANKCFALGTIAPIDKNNKDFIDFFGTDVLQPMRKTIMEKHGMYPDVLDSVIRQYEDFTFMRHNPNDSTYLKFIKRYAPSFIQRFVLSNQHKKYYAFDVVKKYNSYRMFVVPEENIGLPSTNVFEGMACGTAFFGIDDPMYTNLGLIPGVHYVPYQKDDLEDLVRQIRHYQAEPKKLEEIANNGRLFVQERFTGEKVAERFWQDLVKMQEEFVATQKLPQICSFRRSF